MTDSESSRGECGRSESAESRERLEFEVRVDNDMRSIGGEREALKRSLKLAGTSPPEAQLGFLQGLVKDSREADAFMKNPKQYAVDHGVLLDPEIVKGTVDAMVFDANVPQDFLRKIGTKGTQALLDLRATNPVGAVPAAVAAGAAAVAAGAAVVEAVVTVVRTSKVDDFLALKGLGPNGIRMPGGLPFQF